MEEDILRLIFNFQNNSLVFLLIALLLLISLSCAACDSTVPPDDKEIARKVETVITSSSQGITPAPQAVNENGNSALTANNGASSKDSFVFDVFGDSKILPDRENWQGNIVLAESVSQINQDHPALSIYLGDGVDQGGPIENMKYFRNYMSNLNASWYPVIGNHELAHGAEVSGQGGDGENNFQQVFSDKLPQRGVSYYSFDYQKSHFIILDTAWQMGNGPPEANLKPGGSQWEWLCRDLTYARPRSQHIFIFGHKPPVSPFQVGGPNTETKMTDGRGSSWGNPADAEDFMKLAAKFQVDAVFSGHIHMYNRMDVQGIPYFITAGAGAGFYAPAESGGYYHYMRCRVAGGQVDYEVVKLPKL